MIVNRVIFVCMLHFLYKQNLCVYVGTTRRMCVCVCVYLHYVDVVFWIKNWLEL